MKFAVVFFFMAIFAIAAAQPGLIKKVADKAKEKLDNFEPITVQGKLVKKAHEKLNDDEYDPITLQAKLIKKTHDALTKPDVEPILPTNKILKKIINKDEDKKEKEN